MSGRQVALFLTVVLGIWTLMHLYVFVRIASLPWVIAHVPRPALVCAALALWFSYPVARILEHRHWDRIALPLEWCGAAWMGLLFLLLSFLVVADVVTLGGWIGSQPNTIARTAAVLAAAALCVVALIQGARPPVIRDYEISLPGLPKEQDGLVVLHISDLHLGTLIGERWARQLVQRANNLQPDLIVLVGDVIDGNADRVQPLAPVLRELRAPLGVWAVTGNHEYHAGLERSLRVFHEAGFRVLRDEAAVIAPGLVIAGVDDLTVRGRMNIAHGAMERALNARPPGATILLSHSPLEEEKAAQLGAGLMLSGHTHHGQVWPFHWFVRLKYRLLAGEYEVNGMTVIVSRGAGRWGPPMRLWHPSEIVRIRLRALNTG